MEDESSDYSQSEEDIGEWYDGDGICPSRHAFDACCRASFDTWNDAASKLPPDRPSYFYLNDFLEMVQNVPQFFHSPPKHVDITGERRSPLVLRSSLELETTSHPTCEQHQKTIDYFQCLGFPSPGTYESTTTSQLSSAGLPEHQGYFTSIVLAWSYVFCCRWVEILECAGMKSQLLHADGEQLQNCFWDLVIHSRWSAQVTRGKATFYAPWMISNRHSNPAQSDGWVQISPNSSLAFDILLDFCTSNGLEEELLLGFGAILMLTSRNAPSLKLHPPTMIFLPAKQPEHNSTFRQLWESLDKCMSLSATQDALDSLLCSAFFDPRVPCNLIGAASLGVKKALLMHDGDNFEKLLHAVAYRRPHLTLLWHAVAYSHLAMPILNLVLSGLPPICLAAAFWTDTHQSFLQIPYYPDGSMDISIPRAYEFSLSYFCRPEVRAPWTPAPPFGSTTIENLGLEIRSHYCHRHIPLSWKCYWNQRGGERLPAGPQHQLKAAGKVNLQCFETGSKWDLEEIKPDAKRDADEQSWGATSRLFNWHRFNEDGLWLQDGTMDAEQIRQLQQHPWIVDPFDDGGRFSKVAEAKPPEVCRESILEWVAKVEP
ncbi:uncharacterized protein CIMG_09798 [Coccidioides immitis RS]|uniref:Uncharacterized protein n=1 Tax=Coccidioides immitis (strain RS) TaxID=246410 RepID=A0A0E1S0J4_COCIM|nr:uncharacterized protein CIMG_09798 [Coccidioides immitis RS]EAS28594.1 hypothetical protein CIMG_09798 [Coccidioides immitis RS]TPX23134.1 hypothetical protein DIZ76_012456 [Coccidioides immitis]